MDVAPKDFLHRQLQRYGVIGFQFQYAFGATTTTGNGNGFGLTILGAFVAGSLVWTSWVPNTFFLIRRQRHHSRFPGRPIFTS